MSKLLEVSVKEHQMLEAWARFGSLGAAARALNIPQSTLSNRKARLAWRFQRAKLFVREVERLQAGLPGALE